MVKKTYHVKWIHKYMKNTEIKLLEMKTTVSDVKIYKMEWTVEWTLQKKWWANSKTKQEKLSKVKNRRPKIEKSPFFLKQRNRTL